MVQADVNQFDYKQDDRVTEYIGSSSIKIHKLIIDELHPVDETYVKGPIIDGSKLSEKIHLFFGKHVENIHSSPGTRSGRFNDPNSSILKSMKNILTLSNDKIDVEKKSEIIEKLSPSSENITEENINFYYHSEILTKSLLDNIGKKASKSFLFVILHCYHETYGDLIALMKMEKVFGVQYSSMKLSEQLDLLPDKSQALQKGALVFKNELELFPVEKSYRANHEETIYHTKIRDSQDSTISKYFMTGFLDNSIVHRDKENTSVAISNIKVFLSPFLKVDKSPNQIVEYIKENFSFGTQTSVRNLVDNIIDNSDLIDKEILVEANHDNESISKDIYTKMLDLNPSSSDIFKLEFSNIEKVTFADKSSDGKLFKLVVAKVSLERNQVLLDIDIDNDEIDDNMILIGISNDLISKDDLLID